MMLANSSPNEPRDAPYRDRLDAGEVLAGALADMEGLAKNPGLLVLALPRGGVPLGAVIADHLNAELDVVMVRKVGAPGHPEVAMGAMATVAGTVEIVQNPRVLAELADADAAFADVAARERVELERREQVYRAGRPPLRIHGRTVVLVDDGVATGATMRAALAAARRLGPERLVAAVPVALGGAIAALKAEAGVAVCPWVADNLHAVGQAYERFDQVSDAEVQQLLSRTDRPEHP